MTFTLRPAVPTDAEAMAEIYMAAFAHDTVSQKVFPRDKPTTYSFWLNMLQEEIPDPLAHFLVITTTTNNTTATTTSSTASSASVSISEEIIIAFAKWNAPQTYPEMALPEWPPGSDIALANHFFGTLMHMKREIMGERMYWYLELIATRPEWQGKGAAGRLLRWGLERADVDGVVAYLEGSPDGVPIYRHFGFRDVERLVVPSKEEGVEDFVEVFMVRDAVKKGDWMA